MENRLTVYKVIGAKVAYYRKLNCYSQYDLAEKLSVSRSVIAKIESGKYNDNIQLNMLFSLAKVIERGLLCKTSPLWGDLFFIIERKES